MTVLGAVFIALTAFGLFKRRALPWILALSAAFPYSAALVIAGNSLYPFHLVAAAATALLIFDRSTERRPIPPALLSPMTLFVGWAFFITAVGPIMFAGQPVLGARTGIDQAVESQDPLSFSVSSIAQAVYLGLTVGAVLYVATRRVSPHIALVPFAVGTVLGSINLASITFGLPWPAALFDTSANVFYSFRYRGGIFNEASEFGGFSVAAAALFAVMIARSTGWLRVSSIVLVSLALINLSQVRAGTALAGLILIVIIGVGAIIWRLVRTGRGMVLIFYLVSTGTIAMLLIGASIFAWGSEIFVGKVGSTSLNARSSSDEFSLELALQTLGLGVGLGSNRPSSFATMLLSCVGVIGFTAFALLIARLIARALRAPGGAPYAWALIAFLAAKAVSLPDLTTPGMWMLIIACMTHATGAVRTPKIANNLPGAVPEIGNHRGPQGPRSSDTTPLDLDRGAGAARRRARAGVHAVVETPVRGVGSTLRHHAGQ